MVQEPECRSRLKPSQQAGLLVALLWLFAPCASAQTTSDYTPSYTNLSSWATGFTIIEVPSGYSLFGPPLFNYAGPDDPLQTPIPNAVPNIFALFTTNYFGVTKIRSDGRFGTAYFTPTVGWTETNMSLLPGEGAVLWNPGGVLTNVILGGVLEGWLTNSLPAGLSLCSSIVPQSGQLTTDLNYPAAIGDAVFFLNADGSYRRYDYWAAGWYPEEPVVRLCEAFWSCKTTPTNWVRFFQSTDSPEFTPTGSYFIPTFAAGPEVTTNNLHRAIPYLSAMPGLVRSGTGRRLQLRATVVNQVAAAYQWQKNGVALTDGLRLTGTQSDTLELTDLQKVVDDGVYTVVGTNAAGRVVAHAASLRVVTAATEAPTFGQPIRTANNVQHRLSVQPGTFYRVQTSADLQGWTDATNFTSTSSTFQLSMPAPTNGVRVFYRLVSP